MAKSKQVSLYSFGLSKKLSTRRSFIKVLLPFSAGRSDFIRNRVAIVFVRSAHRAEAMGCAQMRVMASLLSEGRVLR